MIREPIQHKEVLSVFGRKEEKFINETNQAEWQIVELRKICDYIKTEKFDTDNKQVCNLITRIKKWLKKHYPKL